MKPLWIALAVASWWCYPDGSGRWHCVPIVTTLQDRLELEDTGPEILPPELDFADEKGVVYVVKRVKSPERGTHEIQ